MSVQHTQHYSLWTYILVSLAGFALTACGGGSSPPAVVTPPANSSPAVCSVGDQNRWLRQHFADTYFWANLSLNPDPSGYSSVETYFDALLSPGDGTFPSDRYSGFSDTVEYNQYYRAGETFAFGVAVAGREVFDRPEQPLWVRYVDPNSPAAAQGVQRGDRVLAMNGLATQEVIARDDFSALVADEANPVLKLDIEREGQRLSFDIPGAVYEVSTVPVWALRSSPSGRRVGYVMVQTMLDQARKPLQTVFSEMSQAAVEAVVLDLRYNAGGFVTVAAELASYAAGAQATGQVFAELRHRPGQSRLNQVFRFSDPADWRGVSRVYVLQGMRSCSASEQLVYGLRGAGLDVITVGDTTCGKPVGFVSEDYCGKTYNVVSFESVNARGEGRYFNGVTANCPVSEKWPSELGATSEALLGAALAHLDSGRCPASVSGPVRQFKRIDRKRPPDARCRLLPDSCPTGLQ
jgi:hypothetical protein